MIAHLTQNQVEDYCLQRLRPVELLSVSDHLGECEACRGRIERALDGDAAFFALWSEVFGERAEISASQPSRAHLTTDQTAGYVDGMLSGDELRMVADHLTNCEQCSLSVADLQSFKDQVATSLDREYHPTVPSSTAPEGWWHRTIESLRSGFRGSPQLAFGTGLMILLLVVIGWLIWRTQPQQIVPKEQIVELPAPPPQPEKVPLVAQLKDGDGRLTLDQEGKLLGAENLPLAYQTMLKDALTGGRIETSPHLKGLTRSPSSLMSSDTEGNEFSVLDPVGRVLMADRPTFRWSRLEGATGYVVEVYDENFALVAASPQVKEASWRTPRSLTRGRVYAWQVKAIKEGQEFTSPRPPAAQARFRILDQRKATELAKAKRAYASAHLTLGLLYAEAGLLREAEQELREVQKANPGSEIVGKLLSRVRALRR